MLLVIYLPFAWLLFVSEPVDYALTWIKMWPILPGLGISVMMKMIPGVQHLPPDGRSTAFLLSILWVGVLIFCSLRLRRAYWPVLTAATLASGVFSWIAYALMKA